MSDYFLLMQGNKVGPLSRETVSEYLAKGKINANQMVSVDDGVFIRLYDHEGFQHLAPVAKEEKNPVTEALTAHSIGNKKLIFVLANIGLFAAFMVFNFNNFSPGHFGVWSQLLLVAVYTIILSELTTNLAVRKSLDIVGYLLVSLMWLVVLVGVSSR